MTACPSAVTGLAGDNLVSVSLAWFSACWWQDNEESRQRYPGFCGHGLPGGLRSQPKTEGDVDVVFVMLAFYPLLCLSVTTVYARLLMPRAELQWTYISSSDRIKLKVR